MCGIFGFLDHQTQNTPEQAKLLETARLLAHRGPDHQAIFSEPSIGLVHTRLSLVDLDPRSHQPFWDKTGRYALVFNGEIYNFRELKHGLESRGVSFRTSGDTEVLMECLLNNEAHDIQKTLLEFEGMFAFALYDRKDRSLFLARDRIGMKPLYVYDTGSCFVFSSEIQAMRPWIPWKANPSMVASYLQEWEGVSQGFTLFQGVASVAPGTFLEVKMGALTERRRFFALSDFWDEEERGRSRALTPQKAVDLVEEKLLASVRQQLQADAPLGIFCSGGVDSSLITAMAAKLHSDVTVFHSNALGKCSEYEAAKALADHLKLEFVSSDATDKDYLERIPDVMEHAEYPYRHLTSSPPFLMLSESASSRGVKGVLTGEAADEIFLGYARYAPNLLRWVSQTPRNSFRWIKKALRGFPPEKAAFPKDFAGRFHQHFQEDIENEDIYRAILKKTDGKLKQKQLLSFYDFSNNIRALTHRNDSMGMAAGLESRFPFLDSAVIRTGLNLPDPYKLRFSPAARDPRHLFIQDKWVIRKVADRYLPQKLSRRVKIPWPSTILHRMEISPDFFKRGCIREWLDLSEREIQYFMEHAPWYLHRTLMFLEVWAHVCFYRNSKQEMVKKMKDHIRIKPEA
jgi:asparagine synthase (glutamine-hydrolysing)